MSTLWWIVVLWLASSFSFLGGYVLRAEMEVWRRMNNDVDLVGAKPIVIDRPRIGA